MCDGLNGVTENANGWVLALENLCKRDNLRFLTMLPWADVLSEQSMLRRGRAWCPDCYEDMFRSESGVYDPLLWFLRPVLICIIHGCLLCSRCPKCDAEGLILSGRTRPGRCAKCESWLGRRTYSNPVPKEALPSSEMKLNERYITSLGHLLETGPANPSPSRETIANSLSSLIAKLADGNAAALARYLDRNKSAIWTWQRCNSRMRLTVLLDVCDRLGISLIEFLTAKTGQATMGGEIILRERKPVLRKKRNWSELKLKLQAVLDNDELVSFSDVSSRLDCDGRTLRYHFPELCRAISAQGSKKRTQLVRNRRAKVAETIRKMVLKLLGEGIYPSRRAVCARLEPKIRSRIVATALTKLHAELGLTHRFSHLRRNPTRMSTLS